MTARQAAGLEPMQPAIRLHGCHRVGNQITGIDPASPEAQRTYFIEPLPMSDSWVGALFIEKREAIREAFLDWYRFKAER